MTYTHEQLVVGKIVATCSSFSTIPALFDDPCIDNTVCCFGRLPIDDVVDLDANVSLSNVTASGKTDHLLIHILYKSLCIFFKIYTYNFYTKYNVRHQVFRYIKKNIF